MKIVSVMTTSSRGGAEFAAVEMLDALIDRGHEAVMLTDQPQIGRDTRVRVRPLEIGAKRPLSEQDVIAFLDKHVDILGSIVHHDEVDTTDSARIWEAQRADKLLGTR